MTLNEYIIGKDIAQLIKLRKPDNSYFDLDADFTNILVYYSNGENVIKFSREVLAGHQLMVRIDANTYLCQLTSNNTILLGSGIVHCSQNFQSSMAYGDGVQDDISSDKDFILKYDTITESV